MAASLFHRIILSPVAGRPASHVLYISNDHLSNGGHDLVSPNIPALQRDGCRANVGLLTNKMPVNFFIFYKQTPRNETLIRHFAL